MAKPKIVIRAFTLRRDITTAMILSRQLERFGYDVYICSSRNYLRVIRFWKPDLVIINTIGHVEITRRLCPFTKIIFLQAEGAKELQEIDHFDKQVEEERKTDFSYVLAKPEVLQSIEKYLIWGSYAYNIFCQRFSEHSHRFSQVGNPRLDIVRYFQRHQPTKSDCFTVGILGRFPQINRFDGVPVIWTLNRQTAESTILSIKQYYLIRKIIDRILSETDFQISYRPHPQESISGYINDPIAPNRVTVAQSYDLSEWVTQMDVIVTPGSTSIVEAFLLDKPTISIDYILGGQKTVEELNRLTASVYSGTINPQSIDELILSLNRPSTHVRSPNPEFSEYLTSIHGWHHDGRPSLSKIIGTICDVLPPDSDSFQIGWPKWILELVDKSLFWWDRYFSYRYHHEFSFHKNFHKPPKDLPLIVSFIFSTQRKTGSNSSP